MNTTEKNGNPLAELDNMYKLLDMHVEEARPEYSRVTMPLTRNEAVNTMAAPFSRWLT